MIYQRNLFVKYPPHNGARLRQVMERLGLSHRVLEEGKDLTAASVDYTFVQEAYETMRQESLAYLKNALK